MLYLAFITGLMASLHCVGMCGPIMLALPLGKSSFVTTVFNTLVYQLGRIFSYTVLGVIVGFTGDILTKVGLSQKAIAIGMGIFLIIFALKQILGKGEFTLPNNPFSRKVNQLMGYFFKNYTHNKIIFVGMLNGLLPCGMVYVALSTASVINTWQDSAMYMLIYGLGTVPLLFLLMISKSLFTGDFRRKLVVAMPYFTLLIGIWVILRGTLPQTFHLHNNEEVICAPVK